MKRRLFILVLSIAAMRGYGQQDSSQMQNEQLEEALVTDYEIRANASFKTEKLAVDSLSQSGRLTLAELLRQQTAIFVKSYGGNGIATLSMRGTGASHSTVFWNNLEINSPMLGLSDLSTLPSAAFNTAQLQYGFGSISDGSGALGGSLRLSSEPNFRQKLKLGLGQFAGSFGQGQTTLSAEGGNATFQAQTQVYRYQAKNDFSFLDITRPGFPQAQMRNNRYGQHGAVQNFFYRPQAGKLLSLKVWYNRVNRQLPPPITGNLNQFDQLLDESLAAIAQYQQRTKKGMLLLNSGLHSANNIFTAGADSSSNNNRFVSWQNNLRYKHNFSPLLSTESGLGFDLEKARSAAYATAVQRQRLSLFSNWNYQLASPTRLHLMLRQELLENTFSPLIASLGLVQELSDKSSLRLNAAHNFRFPSLNDLYWNPGGNRQLQPEKSWNFEAGYSFRSSEKTPFRYEFSATAFYNLVDNWIQWAPVGNIWAPQNLKEVVNQGLELQWKGGFKWQGLAFNHNINYAYTRSQTVEVYARENQNLNKQLPFVPFHKLTAGLAVAFKKWELRYNQIFSGRYFTANDNKVYMPAYTVSNLSLLHRDLLAAPVHKLLFAINLNNLFNMPYQILPYRPEPGINFSVQLTYSYLK